MDLVFEWDESKAVSNLQKHGVWACLTNPPRTAYSGAGGTWNKDTSMMDVAK